MPFPEAAPEADPLRSVARRGIRPCCAGFEPAPALAVPSSRQVRASRCPSVSHPHSPTDAALAFTRRHALLHGDPERRLALDGLQCQLGALQGAARLIQRGYRTSSQSRTDALEAPAPGIASGQAGAVARDVSSPIRPLTLQQPGAFETSEGDELTLHGHGLPFESPNGQVPTEGKGSTPFFVVAPSPARLQTAPALQLPSPSSSPLPPQETPIQPSTAPLAISLGADLRSEGDAALAPAGIATAQRSHVGVGSEQVQAGRAAEKAEKSGGGARSAERRWGIGSVWRSLRGGDKSDGSATSPDSGSQLGEGGFHSLSTLIPPNRSRCYM